MRATSLKVTTAARIKSAIWKIRLAAGIRLKRTMDVSVSLIALIVLSPLFLLVGLLIKRDSTGDVFFKQERVGMHGVTFDMWKFRSMVSDAESERAALESSNEMATGVLFKMKCDPRVTKVGWFIRKASIDELPQLFNVLRGDMSLVGPRPPLMSEVRDYKRSDCRRLEAIPGITCEWQVSGRSNIPFEQQVELDVQYIRNQSLRLDLALLIKTIPAVLFARGAY
ncbi:MAG: lipopolysaccharide/colanic/teichoic acid biosynthesis glycosyltransferase [Arenicella sp.]|jgi:lipopolysaccharide/colanic/teichoic acid biosynthesis glycosyltransferase